MSKELPLIKITLAEFNADPGKYIKNLSKQPFAVTREDGTVFMTVCGLIDLCDCSDEKLSSP